MSIRISRSEQHRPLFLRLERPLTHTKFTRRSMSPWTSIPSRTIDRTSISMPVWSCGSGDGHGLAKHMTDRPPDPSLLKDRSTGNRTNLLFTMSRRTRQAPRGHPAKLLLLLRTRILSAINRAHTHQFNRELVELDGIEPTTSCLQSTRSPN